jgi:hypothetical protein
LQAGAVDLGGAGGAEHELLSSGVQGFLQAVAQQVER